MMTKTKHFSWITVGALLSSLFLLPPKALAKNSDPIQLHLSANGGHDAEIKETESGVYKIRTTGQDPFVRIVPLPKPIISQPQQVLSFEYTASAPVKSIQIFLAPPETEQSSLHTSGLAAGETWTNFSVDLQESLEISGGKATGLRIDLGSRAGKIIQIRSLQLRPPTPAELAVRNERIARQKKDKEYDDRLLGYLNGKYSCEVSAVKVDSGKIFIEGKTGKHRKSLLLVEVPLSSNAVGSNQIASSIPLKPANDGSFSIQLNRLDQQNGTTRDRLLSRWAVARKTRKGIELLSSAHCADSVESQWNLAEEKPRNKKGLGGFWWNRPLSDVEDLKISSITVNIWLNGLFRSSPGDGRTAFQSFGRTWYVDNAVVADLDHTLIEARKRSLIVSAIILVNQAATSPDQEWGKLVAHPDAHPSGIYAMPNVSNEEGLKAYAAALDFLAKRYSEPSAEHGRIHHWILHNEIDAGWEWTNAGEKTTLAYLELYYKSMRAAYLVARQYNPHAKVFISLAHHWTQKPSKHMYGGRELLEDLLMFSRAEGDFDWGIAYHPYPANLHNPRTWEDKNVDDTFDTPQITPRNLEVLDRWVKQPKTFYLGKYQRTVHLTEQGFNSPDYSEKSLEDQAAAMSYTWKKVEALSSIEAFQYHNWVDNRAEGGLRIGLRKFLDDEKDPGGRKPIWFTYQALGTNNPGTLNYFKSNSIPTGQ